jgi:Ser/Thr protein kinase RdoA (MazF antagonist)
MMGVMFGGKQSLPALASVLAPEPLLRAAREHYTIERGASCQLARHSVNDTYVITAPGQRFALRVYRHEWRRQADIQWELSLLEHLDAEGAPIAAPLRTHAGNRFAIVAAPEGPRPVALFRFAAGRPCPGEAMTVLHARAFGRALAAVHLRMDTFQPAHARFELGLDYLLREPIKALEPFLVERPQDLTYLRRLADDIREAVVEFDDRGLARGFCHGNATSASAHLDQRGEFTFFDFDSAGAGWRSYDLAGFRWDLLRSRDRAKADEAFEAFLEGYREVRGLPKVDEEAVPPFVAAREIWLLGLQARLATEQGYATLDDAHFDRAINFLHDWYKEMLAYS